jgi:hypothetical protein
MVFQIQRVSRTDLRQLEPSMVRQNLWLCNAKHVASVPANLLSVSQ